MNKGKRNLTFKEIEIRSNKDEASGKKFIEGVIPYNSKSVPMWGTVEIIDRTAFHKTLADKTEVRALWNHNDNYVLGSTKNSTLALEDGENGLTCRCELINTSYANDLFELVSRGDVKTMSFGFRPIKWADSENGKVRTLKEVQLKEVSFGVPFPAYEKTDSQTFMRGLNSKMKTNIEDAAAVLEKEELAEEDLEILKQFVTELESIINSHSEEETDKKETEAADEKKPPEDKGTSKEEKSTSGGKIDPKTIEEGNQESVKQEILSLIETLFSIEKEKEKEKSTTTTKGGGLRKRPLKGA